MDIRNGKFQNNDHTFKQEFFELVDDLGKKFLYASENTVLPDKPDWEQIEDFVMRVNRETVLR